MTAKKKNLIIAVAFVLVIAIVAAVWVFTRPDTDVGAKTVTVDIIYDSTEKTVEIKTDEEYGIKFATEEQAEKAVEKLEAWKRLKNGGFKFKGYYLGLGGNFSIKFETGTKCNTKDLDLLFSGEDD
jgi:uncharacterized protein YxeA